MQIISPKPILAVVYSDGALADRFLAGLGYSLRQMGVKIAGLVQHNTFAHAQTRCDMALEELYSSQIKRLSENRGPGARGCRLDRSALAEAVAWLMAALDQHPRMLILNKFGNAEMDGGGVRDAISAAVGLSVPVIVGVPARNLEPWNAFAGGMAQECPVDSAPVRRWLLAAGILGEDWRQRLPFSAVSSEHPSYAGNSAF